MALKGKTAALFGSDPNPAVVELALERGIIEEGSCSSTKAAEAADLIILAAPVNGILSILEDLPQLHPGRAVVLDLGSTKQQIAEAMGKLPSRFEPLGGHPMCGSEKSGMENAHPELFRNAPFALTLLPNTTPRARFLAEQVVEAVGARAVVVEAEAHDQWTAATSHLPYLAACALSNATPVKASPLVGPGFRSATRLAGSSPEMMLDILATNRSAVLEALAVFRHELGALEELLQKNDWNKLMELLEHTAAHQKRMAGEKP